MIPSSSLDEPTGAPQPAPRSRRYLYLLASLLVSAVFLVLAFRGVEWGQLFSALKQANPVYLIAAMGVVTLAILTRSLRWRVLLSADEPVDLSLVYWACQVGYLANNFLPARAGDVIRSALLSRKIKAGVSYVLATTVTERIVDAIALVLFSMLSLLALPSVPDWLLGAARVIAIAGVAGLAVLFVAPHLERHFTRLLRALPGPEGLRSRVIDLMSEFLRGMKALQRPGPALVYAGLTAVIWLMDAATMMTVARGFALHLSLPQAMLLIAALGLASAAPSTPGYLGVYQFVAVTVLVPFGFTQSQALADIFGFQATTYLTVIIWGSIGLWKLNVFPGLGARAGRRGAAAGPRAGVESGSVPDGDSTGSEQQAPVGALAGRQRRDRKTLD